MKGDLDGTFLLRALLAAGKNCIQLASYNIVCGYDCHRVLKHVWWYIRSQQRDVFPG